MIFNPICSCRTSKSASTKLSPPTLLIRHKLESAHEILARTLRRSVRSKHLRLAGVRAGLYDQDSVRVRTYSDTVSSQASSRPTRCNVHPESGGTEATRATKVTPPCPSTGTMIRLKMSVLSRIICCTMLLLLSSSCLTSKQHSCNFTLVHGLSSSLFNSSDESSALHALITLRTRRPGKCRLSLPRSGANLLCTARLLRPTFGHSVAVSSVQSVWWNIMCTSSRLGRH